MVKDLVNLNIKSNVAEARQRNLTRWQALGHHIVLLFECFTYLWWYFVIQNFPWLDTGIMI